MRRVANHTHELATVLFSQLDAIQDSKLSEEAIESLLLTCGDSMLLAALDLVDSSDVSRIVVNADKAMYRCAGTSTTYSVALDPPYCPCPAFSQQVLYLQAHVLCKHVLACLLASKLGKVIKRDGSLDLLAQLALDSSDFGAQG